MKLQKFYSIGEAANLAGTTIETLRHYDRIGLLKPAKIDSESRYRYYTDTELIYLEVIAFCRKNKMSISEIKELLNADIPKAVSFLQSVENHIETEIRNLYRTKEQLSSLCKSLQEQAREQSSCVRTEFLEQRAIFLAEQLHEVSVENFWRLHNDIYQTIQPDEREEFLFDHTANLLLLPEQEMEATMFAVCKNYSNHSALHFLGEGEYLCCTCTEKNKEETINNLYRTAKGEYCCNPKYIVLNVQFTGLFQWQYDVQIPLF